MPSPRLPGTRGKWGSVVRKNIGERYFYRFYGPRGSYHTGNWLGDFQYRHHAEQAREALAAGKESPVPLGVDLSDGRKNKRVA